MQKSKYELAITLSAIFISLCAFFVSIYQTNVLKEQTTLMQEQQHATVWPRLFIARTTGSGISKFIIRNDGVGPAQIRHVEVRVRGQIMKRWNEVLAALTNKNSFTTVKTNINNRVIRSGDEFAMLNILDESTADSVNANSKNITIIVYYSSIYGRTWVLNQDFGKQGFAIPEQVETTEYNEDNQFLD